MLPLGLRPMALGPELRSRLNSCLSGNRIKADELATDVGGVAVAGGRAGCFGSLRSKQRPGDTRRTGSCPDHTSSADPGAPHGGRCGSEARC